MSGHDIKLVERRDARLFSPESGLLRQVLVYSDNMMLVRHLMEEGWVGVRHSHPHEQLVYVIHGHLRFTGGDKTFDAQAGDSFVVPGGIEHQASALEPSEVLDVFAPFREDYAENR
ncbi:MAG TPA: cupin domain-containing protein [Silvibacterium sp.]|nr:cupin domain-containing protein [Silvibacterium sp.]